MSRFYGTLAFGCFFEIAAEGVRRQKTHQAVASWKQSVRQQSRHPDHHTRATLVIRRTRADSPSEEIAEAAEARHADFHAHFGNIHLALREQDLRPLEARLDSILMRR